MASVALAAGAAGAFALYRGLKSHSLDSMSTDARLHAKMSSAAYEEPDERSNTIDDYILLSRYSNKRLAMYVSDSQKRIIVAIRGTTNLWPEFNNPMAGASIAADANICCLPITHIMQRFHWIIAEMQGVIDFASKRGYRISITGHSLGGMLAMSYFVRDTSGYFVGGHVFNAGGGMREAFRLITFGTTEPEIQLRSRLVTHHHIYGDPISVVFSRGNLRIYQPKNPLCMSPLKRHAIDQFL
mmetsp:Transcript_15558/g.21256  ORF Transcript_15558/g.21256 Transcript_15558/m.21256 type:complete len:242 (-) Transcript_15558:376-1101(-)|eukprot:CAMPEP_0185723090 /NCGR_PEP_ID=MMETSP1171-20130828/37_1 /TAXON_ID=374046 /ORGANISM="Helicotheca tamensis, Strain CCMP826" /LENGTH=241 /DNA_ID=CAMNT_0028390753 /DNA_START=78 /DNA_END=803 /DNA_ORIENTATION=+